MNARLREQQLSARLVAHELEIARGIQRSLLPKNFPQLPGFTIAADCESARQVGGDFYDRLQISDSSALLVIADVMGKGVPAALFAALLRSLIRANLSRSFRPAEVLGQINRFLFDDLSAVDMFITAQIVLLDCSARHLIIGNAGHNPLLLGSADSKEVQQLRRKGCPWAWRAMRPSTNSSSSCPLNLGSSSIPMGSPKLAIPPDSPSATKNFKQGLLRFLFRVPPN